MMYSHHNCDPEHDGKLADLVVVELNTLIRPDQLTNGYAKIANLPDDNQQIKNPVAIAGYGIYGKKIRTSRLINNNLCVGWMMTG